MAGRRNYHLDKIGKRYGRLVFVGMTDEKYQNPSGDARYLAKFVCDCGNDVNIVPQAVFDRRKKYPMVSCGCVRSENANNQYLQAKRKEGTHKKEINRDLGETGYRHIRKVGNRYSVKIVRNDKTYQANFSTLDDAIAGRDLFYKVLEDRKLLN